MNITPTSRIIETDDENEFFSRLIMTESPSDIHYISNCQVNNAGTILPCLKIQIASYIIIMHSLSFDL